MVDAKAKVEKVLTQEEINDLLKPFHERIRDWQRVHGPNQAPPLQFNPQTDQFTWMNRETRRKAKIY